MDLSGIWRRGARWMLRLLLAGSLTLAALATVAAADGPSPGRGPGGIEDYNASPNRVARSRLGNDLPDWASVLIIVGAVAAGLGAYAWVSARRPQQ